VTELLNNTIRGRALQGARHALRHLLKGVSLRRRLPEAFGQAELYVSPESQLKYLKPWQAGFDRSLLNWADELVHSGQTVWDIGANVGVFAFAAAGKGATVLAVEPDPFLANLLLRSKSLRANAGLNVSVAACAVAETSTLTRLEIASGGRAANRLSGQPGVRKSFGRTMQDLIVPTIPLDALLTCSAPPRLVKVDVEGAELSVLGGGITVLSEARPVWIIECSSDTWPEAASILRKFNYRLYDADKKSRDEISSPAFNTLAVPE
jgi:FkbM family methyltransferase